MSLKVDGLNNLINTLDELGTVGDRIGKKAVRAGLNIVLKQQKSDAPRAKNTKNSWKCLKIKKLKKYKGGTVWGSAGLGGDDWEKWKGLYYQHFGYIHNLSGEKITKHVGWMNESFEKAKQKAENEIIKVAIQEVDKILR